jgi:hypothetical protein
MLLLLLLWVARVRTPADSLMMRGLDFTHGWWRIDMRRGNVVSVRVLRLPVSRLGNGCCYFRN